MRACSSLRRRNALTPKGESARLPIVVVFHSVTDAEPTLVPWQLPKRAARRIIQRAFVLAGRDRNVRQHVREAAVASLWTIEDWDLSWTLLIHRGRLEFDRRPTKKPDMTFTWRTAEDFFREAHAGARGQTAAEVTGNLSLRRFADPVRRAFWAALSELLNNPVDEDGDPLV